MGPGHQLDRLYGLAIEIISRVLASQHPLGHVLFSAWKIAVSHSFGLWSELILVCKQHLNLPSMEPGQQLDGLYRLVIEIISKVLASRHLLRQVLFFASQIAFSHSFGLRSELIMVCK